MNKKRFLKNILKKEFLSTCYIYFEKQREKKRKKVGREYIYLSIIVYTTTTPAWFFLTLRGTFFYMKDSRDVSGESVLGGWDCS